MTDFSEFFSLFATFYCHTIFAGKLRKHRIIRLDCVGIVSTRRDVSAYVTDPGTLVSVTVACSGRESSNEAQ